VLEEQTDVVFFFDPEDGGRILFCKASTHLPCYVMPELVISL